MQAVLHHMVSAGALVFDVVLCSVFKTDFAPSTLITLDYRMCNLRFMMSKLRFVLLKSMALLLYFYLTFSL